MPPGSVVRFRGPSLWDEYRQAVLIAAAVLMLQSLLIAALLYERRARQRAETDSRRNLALAADANRRDMISALASSIGHELGQPLSSIRYNTQALQLMVKAHQATPDETGEILADIQADAVLATRIIDRHGTLLRSHQLQKKPIDLRAVIDESLALVSHDMRTRHVEVSLDLSSTPCVIDGDQVLLVQVLVNLLKNAIDAMAETPPEKRRIRIRSAGTTREVEVSVSDAGAGLPAEIIGKLFTPFVTTKPHGLGVGLPIAQRIVDAHGGTIGAHQNSDGGATFTVTLPRSATPGLLPDHATSDSGMSRSRPREIQVQKDQLLGKLEHTLAEFVAGLRLPSVPAETQRVVRRVVMAVAGTGFAGAAEDGVLALRELLVEAGGAPQATVLVYGDRLPARAAAQFNGTMCRALDFCDAMAPGPHIGAALFPAALAAAELAGGCSGEEFLTALVAGAELSSRFNLSEAQYDGFDPTGIVVVFSAAAAASRILGLTPEQTLHALALAFNRCGGSFQSHVDGSLGVRVVQGWVAEAGVQCAQMAQRGITGPVNFLSGHYGFAHLYGRGTLDAESVTRGLGETWKLGTSSSRSTRVAASPKA